MVKKAKKRFTDDFKKDAVNLVVKQGYSNTESAKSLDVSASAIRTWIKKFGPNRDIKSFNQEAEIKRLKKENERLRVER